VARKDMVERLCKSLESKGYRPSKIFATPRFGGVARQLELVRAGQGGLSALPFLSHPLTGLAAIGLALLFSAAISQLRESQITSAADQSEAARLQASSAIGLAQRASALRATAEEIAALRKAPRTSALLGDLAAKTPDDAWLDRVTVAENEVRISGYALTAASVLSELGHSQFLANISFATPVVVDAGSGKERFDIRADLVNPAAGQSAEATP
jgi:general secretion pathway protein L